MESLPQKLSSYIEKHWQDSALPALQYFIRIPNLSKLFDPDWNTNGLLEKAAKHLADWTKSQNVKNCTVEVLKEPKLSPLIFIEIEGSTPDAGNILMYGHLDKQPHLTGWSEGLGPLDPVIRDIKPSLENTPYSFFQGLFSNRVLFTWKFFTSLGLIFYKLKRPLSELQNFFLAITEFASVFIFYPKTFSSKNSKKVYIQKWATPQTIQKKPSISEYG